MILESTYKPMARLFFLKKNNKYSGNFINWKATKMLGDAYASSGDTVLLIFDF